MHGSLKKAVALLIAGLIGAAWLSAQVATAPAAVYQVVVGADPVRVDVAISDATGKAVFDLKPEDFEIYEDGELQTIQNFSTVGMPYSILLLVDRSPKESKNKWPDFVLKSVDLFLKNLRGPDRLAVAAFDSRVAVLVDWRPSRTGMQQRVMLKHSEQPTRFFEAMNWAAEEMQYVSPAGVLPEGSRVNALKGRKGVIVFTDGRDIDMYPRVVHLRGEDIVDPNYSVPASVDERFRNTRQTLVSGRIPFYFVAVDTDRQLAESSAAAELPGWMRFLGEVRTRIEQLAAASGGRAVFPRQIEDLLPLYGQIHRELGSGYQISYSPSRTGDGRRRSIEVRLKNAPPVFIYQSHASYIAR